MAKTIFHNIKFRNFLAVGNAGMEYQLDKHNHTLITGRNGEGKCLHSETLIDININDPEVLELFNKHLCQENETKNDRRESGICIKQN